MWEPLEEKVSSFSTEVDDTTTLLEKLALLPRAQEVTDANTILAPPQALSLPSTMDEPASLPCFIWPSPKIIDILDRTDDVVELDRYFRNADREFDQPFSSLTLHGVGGAGKSSIALKVGIWKAVRALQFSLP